MASKQNSGSPFSLFSFAYLAYFAVSSGALGSSLPAATGGGFGFAPQENPGPRPPKAGAALSPTGQGKFRRDEQGGLVQKLESGVHLIRPAATFSPARRRRIADGAFAQVKRPNGFRVHDFLPVR
jgi:hypothetical protein